MNEDTKTIEIDNTHEGTLKQPAEVYRADVELLLNELSKRITYGEFLEIQERLGATVAGYSSRSNSWRVV